MFNASVNALRPELNFLDYNASKAAVVSMAKSLAMEVSGRGVAVTALCPGYFPTRMTAPYLDDPGTRDELLARIPAGRFGDLAEIAALVDFLLSAAGGLHDRQRRQHRRRGQHLTRGRHCSTIFQYL